MQGTINKRVKDIRKLNNLSQIEFSNRLNIKQATLSQIENAVIMPSVDIIKLIIGKFNINYEWLIDGTGQMQKVSKYVADGGKASEHVIVADKMVSENEHLKAELSDKNSQIADLRDHISTLKTQLSECQNDKKLLLNSVFSDKKTVK